jgi:AcrR family transcriptional regulator
VSDKGRASTELLQLDTPPPGLETLDAGNPLLDRNPLDGGSQLDARSPGESEGDVADEVNLLITATWTVAARTGSFEPSVREILQEAGVSTKAFYRHFRSKDDLLLVALETASCQLADYIESKMAPLDAPVPRIRVWLEGFMRQAIVPSAARRTLPWALGVGQLAHLYPDEFDHSKALVIAPLEREITEAVARGTAMSPNPARDARIIFGYTMDAIRHHLIRRTEPDSGDTEQLVDFTYRALGISTTD